MSLLASTTASHMRGCGVLEVCIGRKFHSVEKGLMPSITQGILGLMLKGISRQEEGGKGWLVKGKGTVADVFVPFAFEVGGALGREAEEFLRECTAVAEWKNQGVGDLAHWSSMTWGGHWRQRIGVEIARGVARCVERAATGGWASSGTGRGCSHEYDPDCG